MYTGLHNVSVLSLWLSLVLSLSEGTFPFAVKNGGVALCQ